MHHVVVVLEWACWEGRICAWFWLIHWRWTLAFSFKLCLRCNRSPSEEPLLHWHTTHRELELAVDLVYARENFIVVVERWLSWLCMTELILYTIFNYGRGRKISLRCHNFFILKTLDQQLMNDYCNSMIEIFFYTIFSYGWRRMFFRHHNIKKWIRF